MDTYDLSREAYIGILIEAEELTHDLTLLFGLLSYKCKDETEFIYKAEKLTREIMQMEDYELDDIFWGNPPEKEKLDLTLKKIIRNIEKVNKIPFEKRHYD